MATSKNKAFNPLESVVSSVPIQPISISLRGILTLDNGNVVLNGMPDEFGVNVHIRGEYTTLESGDISICGILMFNPQQYHCHPIADLYIVTADTSNSTYKNQMT